MIFGTIKEGAFVLSGIDETERSFSLDDEGREALRATCAEHEIESFQTSSSCDFPEENGAPEDFDIDAFIQHGLTWRESLLGIHVSDLKEMVKRLEAGDVASVLKAVKAWVAQAEEQS